MLRATVRALLDGEVVRPATADIRDPYRVAPDTWVSPEIVPGPLGTIVPLNSMVITAAEPVIVDTGNELSRAEWLEAAFSIVEPEDDRWVFLSHDDHDHSGNLAAVLDLCRNATLVTTQFTVERRGPGHRAADGPHAVGQLRPSSFDVGDRTLVAMRPPVFDSPVDPRAVRHQDRRLLGGRHVRHRRCPATWSTRPTCRPPSGPSAC